MKSCILLAVICNYVTMHGHMNIEIWTSFVVLRPDHELQLRHTAPLSRPVGLSYRALRHSRVLILMALASRLI
jgi:hypothetical protein